MIDKSRLTGGGNLLTQALFYELNGYNKDTAVYTLADNDMEHNGVVIYAIKNLYVNMEDIHEYDFATTYFSSWKHWQRLLDSPRVRPYIDTWREELEMKIRSRNIKRMEELASSGDRQAIKYLADKGWVLEQPTARKRGRPSKDEVTGELKNQAADAKRVADDYTRIMQ